MDNQQPDLQANQNHQLYQNMQQQYPPSMQYDPQQQWYQQNKQNYWQQQQQTWQANFANGMQITPKQQKEQEEQQHKAKLKKHDNLRLANLLLNFPMVIIVITWLIFSLNLSTDYLNEFFTPIFYLIVGSIIVIPLMIAQFVTSIMLFCDKLSNKNDIILGIVSIVISLSPLFAFVFWLVA